MPNDKSDGGAREVQEVVDQANEQGFIGEKVDQTPNEAYTVQGVASGQPTPTPQEAIRQSTEAGKTTEQRDRKD